MKIIKLLSEHIESELEDAEHYAKLALHYKEEHPNIAKTFFDLSVEEMDHVERLHNDVVDMIEKYRKEHGEPPAAMKAVYDYLHEKNVEWAKEIRVYHNQYKGM